jgi:hypothetical protein
MWEGFGSLVASASGPRRQYHFCPPLPLKPLKAYKTDEKYDISLIDSFEIIKTKHNRI